MATISIECKPTVISIIDDSSTGQPAVAVTDKYGEQRILQPEDEVEVWTPGPVHLWVQNLSAQPIMSVESTRGYWTNALSRAYHSDNWDASEDILREITVRLGTTTDEKPPKKILIRMKPSGSLPDNPTEPGTDPNPVTSSDPLTLSLPGAGSVEFSIKWTTSNS